MQAHQLASSHFPCWLRHPSNPTQSEKMEDESGMPSLHVTTISPPPIISCLTAQLPCSNEGTPSWRHDSALKILAGGIETIPSGAVEDHLWAT